MSGLTRLHAIVLFGLFVIVTPPASAASSARIGIVLDGPSARFDKVRELVVKEVFELTQDEFTVSFPADKTLTADWTRDRVRAALDRLLADEQVDMVLALGVIASDVVATRGPLPKPVVAPFILSRQVQRVPYADGASGVRNLAYITFPFDLARDLRLFRRIANFERLSFIADGAILAAVPELKDALHAAAQTEGVKVVTLPLAPTVDKTLSRIHPDTEAVLLGALLRLDEPEFAQLVEGINARQLPTFAISGRPAVEQGALAGSASSTDTLRVARRTALDVQRILLGEQPEMLEVDLPGAARLAINIATASAIGISLTWTILRDADQVGEGRTLSERTLTLESVVQEAIAKNLDIAIAERAVAAGAENIPRARSALLPQLGVRGDARQIDRERAELVPGISERETSGSLTLNQLIYGETQWANLAIQELQQTAREADRDGVKLNIVLGAANTYLDVLRAKSNERIQREDVELTRANLDTARLRRRVGTGTPAEVYRWESQLANARRLYLQFQAQTRVTEIALNRLLRRPLDERFETMETGLDDPILITSYNQLFELIDRPANYARFGDFMVEEGLLASPEMRQIDALIKAQERFLKSTKAAFWQPQINFSAEYRDVISTSGAGGPALTDEPQTTVGVRLSLPLFTGGARRADKQQAAEVLEQLRLERTSTDQQVEQDVRSQLETVRAAYSGIRLARESARAARRNYEIVKDQYTRGIAPIILLLDAQNNWIVADQAAANAVHDFLKELMGLERATSRFDFFVSREEQLKWFERLKQFLAHTDAVHPPGATTR